MKKSTKILSLLLITIFSISVKLSAQHVNIGVKGGVNFYNIHNDNTSQYDIRPGFNVGLVGHIHLNKSFALEPELVYSSQGARYTNNGVKHNLKLNYINLPVMLQFMFANGFRLQAGPQLGLLVQADNKSINTTDKVKDDFKALDFGVGFGAGYVFPSTGFGIDARYNAGLSNINKNGTAKSTNQGLQVGIFYLFGHK